MIRRGGHIRDLRKLSESIEGWLTIGEGAALYELARRCSALGAIVEIGSWQGKSTVWLAHGSRGGAGSEVFAVDPHTGSPEHRDAYGEVWTLDAFKRNVERAGVADLVVPVVATSAEAAERFDRPVGLVFVDGAHDYASVTADWKRWSPYLVDGGVLAFHDTAPWSGDPRRAMQDAFLGTQEFTRVRFVDSLTYAEKRPGRSAWAGARNTAMLRVARPAYEWAKRRTDRMWALVRWHVLRGGRSPGAQQLRDGDESESAGP